MLCSGLFVFYCPSVFVFVLFLFQYVMVIVCSVLFSLFLQSIIMGQYFSNALFVYSFFFCLSGSLLGLLHYLLYLDDFATTFGLMDYTLSFKLLHLYRFLPPLLVWWIVLQITISYIQLVFVFIILNIFLFVFIFKVGCYLCYWFYLVLVDNDWVVVF